MGKSGADAARQERSECRWFKFEPQIIVNYPVVHRPSRHGERQDIGAGFEQRRIKRQLSLVPEPAHGVTRDRAVHQKPFQLARRLPVHRHLNLTGTHVGCDTAQCGACTVMVNGRSVKSCNMLAAQAEGADVTTIEGLAAADGTLHPMQAAFKECHGLQCGYCTPGMVMSAVDLCNRHPNASEAEIREQLEGNLCRCTGYQNIVKAVQQGAAAMKA